MSESRYHRRLIVLLPVCFSLFACSGVLNSDKPAGKTFWLKPYEGQQTGENASGLAGLSLVFEVVPGLDSDHLLTLDANAELNHFAAARWPDYLPEFAGSLVRRSLQNSGLWSRVSMAGEGEPEDCELALEAQEFHTIIDGSGRPVSVRMTLAGVYDCHGAQGRVDAVSSLPVNGGGLAAIVAAHQQAFNQQMRSLVDQLRVLGDAADPG